jgi:KipI family sensor histidine kinase inhibitor
VRRVRAAGDAAFLIDWPDEPEALANRKARAIHARLARRPPAGVQEAVPGARSLLLRIDPDRFRLAELLPRVGPWETDFAALSGARAHEIPIWYGGEAGIDLEELAAEHGLSADGFAGLHSSADYIVAFLGFTPGFPYLTGLPERLACPRLPVPRLNVPAGSVAIGGPYSGIYPASSPGGWRLIGRTPLCLFDPFSRTPALLSPGDRVRFVPIDRAGFSRLAQRAGAFRR